MSREVSPKVAAYAALGGLALIAALVTRRPELAALGAPFLLLLGAGFLTAADPELRASVRVGNDRLLEGDVVDVEVELTAAHTVERLELLLEVPAGMALAEGENPIAVRLVGSRTITLRLVAERWGAYEIGNLTVRARDAFGLFARGGQIRAAAPVKVFPKREALRRLLRPADTQLYSGDELSRTKGEGLEFADLRPFTFGDRMKRINWRASARRGELWVNEQHPERNVDVVLFVDSFAEVKRGSASTLDLAVRAASTLAERYITAAGPGRARLVRRLSALADSRRRDRPAVPDHRRAARHRDHAQPRVEGDRPHPHPHAAAAGARGRADTAARRALRQRPAAPARPRLRPRRDRAVAARLRRPGADRAGPAGVPALAPPAGGAARTVPRRRGGGGRVAGRRAVRPPGRGGDRIPAPRRRTRLILGIAAVTGAAGLAAYAAVDAARLGVTIGIVGAIGVIVLAVALSLRLTALITPALALLGAEYAALFVVRGDTIDVRAPLYAAGFLVVAELAFATLELRAGAPEAGLVPRRAAMLVAIAAGSVITGAVVLAAAAAPLEGGIALEAVGLVAAVVLLVALGRVAVRSR